MLITTNVHVSTGSTPVSTASTNNSTACLSDAIVYAYLATQPNGSQVVHEDLEQIHEDDLDEMDLKWQLALLKKVDRVSQFHKLGNKLESAGNPRSQRNRENRKDLKLRYDKLRIELNKSESDLYSYKKGLASVEEQLVFYKKNEGASESISKEVKKTLDAPIIEDWVSDDDEDETVMLESLNVISVNTVKGKRMTSAVGEQGINAVKPTTYWAWRPKIKMINHVYKNTGSCIVATLIMSELIVEKSVMALEAKDSEVCKITRKDGSSSFHGDIQALLRRLDRQDLRQLYSLVQERFKDHPLEGHDLDLWGDLRMLFDPNEEDDIWLNQQYWELLRWKLHEYSGVHSLFLDGTSIQINMLVEKKYPLKKESLEKMINLKIEAEEESTMAHELIKFNHLRLQNRVNHKFRGGLLGIKELLQDNAAEGLITAVSYSYYCAKPSYHARKDFLACHLPGEWEISRDVELNPFKDTLVFRRMVEFLGAIPINLKNNMWESKDLIKNPINWGKLPKTEMEHGMPRLD
ncbi:hypothetical protein Tco_0079072 [Tanacetum coccineum]